MTTKDKVEERIIDLLGLEPIDEEIHLEHLLMAIEKVNQEDETIAIDFRGGISAFIDNDRYEIGDGGVKIVYNLSKPFSDQSEELYSFLLDIIK